MRNKARTDRLAAANDTLIVGVAVVIDIVAGGVGGVVGLLTFADDGVESKDKSINE